MIRVKTLVKLNIMTNTEKEATGDVAVVEKVDTAAVAQISASNERLSQMDKLNRKLKAKKATTTKNLKKLEAATVSFQEAGKEESAMRL